MINKPNNHLSGFLARSGLGKSAFALAISAVLSGTAFAGNAGNATDYDTDLADVSQNTTTVTSSITFPAGAINPAASTAGAYTLQGVASITQPVLNGAAATTAALDAVTNSIDVALIKNLHFTQFTVGAVSAGNIARLEDIRFSANNGSGAVAADNLTGGIANANFVANTNGVNGGALTIAQDLDGELNNVRFANNTSSARGGAIYVGQDFGSNDASSAIVGSEFNGNNAVTDGGAIAVVLDFDGVIDGTQFDANAAATGSGGALYVAQDFGAKLNQTSEIKSTSFTNNTAGANGGAVAVAGTFDGTVIGSTFTSNTAAADGGAIHVAGNLGLKANSTTTIDTTTFEGNSAANGGAIAANQSVKVDINNATFKSNAATAGNGGAIKAGSALTDTFEANINGSTFDSNTAIAAGGNGGAIAVFGDAKLNIDGASVFNKNEAGDNGGAIAVGRDLDGSISGTFTENKAVADSGGAIVVARNFGANATSSVTSATFSKNTAQQDGGAIAVGNAVADSFKGNIVDSVFSENEAVTGDGGAVFVSGAFNGDISGVTVFEKNKATAGDGGAVSVGTDFTGNVTGATFRENEAVAGHGAAVYVTNDFKGNIDSAIFETNKAAGNGGGLYVGNDLAGNVTNSAFENNEGASGGAIRVGNDYDGKIDGANFRGNKATAGSGGAIEVVGNIGANAASSIENTVFANNTSVTDGGAVRVGGNVTANFTDVEFTGNSTSDPLASGGALHVGGDFKGDITGANTFVDSNKSNVNGAINIVGDFDGKIADGRFSNNEGTLGLGGAIAIGGNVGANATSSIEDAAFVGNKSGAAAGAVGVLGNFTGNIKGSTFTNNETTGAAANAGAFGVGGNFTGDIDGSTFEGNKAGQNGGAVAVGGNFVGNIKGSSFENNVSNEDGGAVIIGGNFTGDIDGATFDSNVATTKSGGAIGFAGNVTGDIKNSTFTDNKAAASAQGGGAFYFLGDFTGAIEDSDFRGNVATERGGAIATWAGSPSNIAPDITKSIFVGNKADGTANTVATNGRGGAIAVNNGFKVTNSTFLANEAIAGAVNWGAADGVGGAIYLNAKDPMGSTLTLDATGADDRILFYGNTNQLGGTSTAVENAIHFANEAVPGNDRVVTVNITGAGDLLLLDGISSQDGVAVGRGRVTVNVNKAAGNTGDVYLGGRSILRDDSTWNIDEGSLVLTTVDYGSGAVAADLNLAGATAVVNIGTDGELVGSGTIHANTFNIDGEIDPSVWTNTGTLANAITNGISSADVDAIGVQAASVNTIGQLTLDGDVNLGANTVYHVDAHTDGSGADNVTVTGTLVIDPNAAISLTVLPGTWTGPVSYAIVNAGNVLPTSQYGTDAFNSGYLFMDAAVDTHATGVDLHLTRNNLAATIGNTFNQTSTGVAIDGLADNNPVVGGIMNIVTVAEALQAFDNLSGEIYSSTGTVLLQNSSHVRNLVADRLAESEVTARARGVWASIYGYTGELKGNSNVVKAENDSFGFAVGGDIPVGQSSNLGLLLGYETADVELKGNRISKANIDTFNIGLYFGSSFGGIQFRSGLAHSRHDINVNRGIAAGYLSGSNISDYDATLTQLFVDFAYPVQVNEKFSVSPYAAISQLWLDVDGARENGTAATLETYDWSANTAVSNLGLRFASTALSESGKVSLHGGLSWQHAFDKEDGQSRRRFWNSTGTSADFLVKGARLGEDVLTINLGVSGEIAENQILGLEYRGEVSSQQKQHGGQLHWSYRF